MFLFIDTTSDEIILALFQENKPSDQKSWFEGKLIGKLIKKARYRQAELLLIEINKLLKNNKMSLELIKGIMVIKGPGSFTGTRVGVSTANALAFALDISILGIKKENLSLKQLIKKYYKKIKSKKPVLPIYSTPPNITLKKKTV
jgi:tRNA threonylcarbamoyladenosine biosynthesis protein TsaB